MGPSYSSRLFPCNGLQSQGSNSLLVFIYIKGIFVYSSSPFLLPAGVYNIDYIKKYGHVDCGGEGEWEWTICSYSIRGVIKWLIGEQTKDEGEGEKWELEE